MNPEVPMWPVATAVVRADGTATLEVHGDSRRVEAPAGRDVRDELIDLVARDLALPLGYNRYVRLNTTDPDGSVGVIGVNHAGDVVAISRTPPPVERRRRGLLLRRPSNPPPPPLFDDRAERAENTLAAPGAEETGRERRPRRRGVGGLVTRRPAQTAVAAVAAVAVLALGVVGFRAATSTSSPGTTVAGAVSPTLADLHHAVIAESEAIAKREAAAARQKAQAAQRAKARRIAAQRKAAQRRKAAAARRRAQQAAQRRATPTPAPRRTTPQPSYTPPRSSSPPRRSTAPAPKPTPRPAPSPAQEFGP